MAFVTDAITLLRRSSFSSAACSCRLRSSSAAGVARVNAAAAAGTAAVDVIPASGRDARNCAFSARSCSC